MRLRAAAALVAALLGSLALNAGLFSFLPLMGYWHSRHGQGGQGKGLETHLIAMTVMPSWPRPRP